MQKLSRGLLNEKTKSQLSLGAVVIPGGRGYPWGPCLQRQVHYCEVSEGINDDVLSDLTHLDHVLDLFVLWQIEEFSHRKFVLTNMPITDELHQKKTNNLHMRKQRHISAVQ